MDDILTQAAKGLITKTEAARRLGCSPRSIGRRLQKLEAVAPPKRNDHSNKIAELVAENTLLKDMLAELRGRVDKLEARPVADTQGLSNLIREVSAQVAGVNVRVEQVRQTAQYTEKRLSNYDLTVTIANAAYDRVRECEYRLNSRR